MQEKVVQLQMVHQQLKQFQQQMQMLEQQMLELDNTKAALEELGAVEKGKDIYVPLAQGIFAKAKWDSDGTFLVNVGAATAVEKDSESVKKMVEEQQQEAAKIKEEMVKQVEKLVSHAHGLENELHAKQ